MRITLRNIYTTLFVLGWFFFPFNDFKGVEQLGEYKNEACTYFFLIALIFLFIEMLMLGKLSIPSNNKLYKILLIFILWCFISTVLNFDTVLDNFFKHTSGINRFFRQYISLLLAAFFFPILYWNVIKKWSNKQTLIIIRKIILVSLFFVFVYGFFETLIVVFGLNFLRPILAVFDYFPFLDVNYPPGNRISSVAYESPSLGNYLITISGWMFSYIFTHKSNYKYLPFFMVVFLTFFSGSRAAFISIGVQIIILLIMMYKEKELRNNVVKIFVYASTIILLAIIVNGPKIIKETDKKLESLNFKKNLTKNISNQSRFGMQYASIQVFKENPFIGVGFGQDTYHKRHHYPGWATKNNFEFVLYYENKNFRSFPTGYNIYTRLASEIGIIGLVFFLYFLYLCINKSYKTWKHDKDNKTFGVILLISFVGMSLNWMQTDFFRQHGFWLCFVILIKILYYQENLINKKK